LKERAIQAFEGLMKTRGGPAATQVIAVLRRAGNTFSAIVTNPKGFLTNLVNALQTGFKQFSSKIVNHLKNGLAAWLTGSLSATGLSVPDKLDARGIVSLALSVLGINYGRVRNILVKRIGGGKVKQLEGGFDLVQRLANGGLAAAVQHMMHVGKTLQQLQTTVIESVRNWVIETVVKAAISKLVATFSGFGAIAVAAQGIYNAIAFLIEQANKIQALVNAVAASIGNIVAGKVSEAANYIESTLARSLSVAISFLARIVGLGNVGQKVREIIGRVQSRVDVAVNKLVDLVAKQGNDWLAKAGGGRPSNAAGGSGRPGSQRPVPPNRTGQPRTPVTQNPRSGQPRTPATRNTAPAPSPRPATRNPAPAPSPRSATRNPAPAPSPTPATRNSAPKPSPTPATRNPAAGPSSNQQTPTPALASYDRQIGKEVRFKADDENHRLWFEMQQSKPVLMVASAKQHLETFLNSQQVKAAFPLPEEYSAVVEEALSITRRAELNAQSLHQILTEASSRDPQNQQAIVQKDNQIEAQQDSLVPLMIKIFNKLAQPSSEQETLQLRVRVERLRESIANLIIHINKDNRLKNLAYQAQAIKAEAEQLAELSDPALKELEPEIAEQENQLEQLEIKFKFPERIDTLAAESQSLLEEIQTVTELDEYEIDALSKPDSLNKDDIADKQRAQLKQKARDKLQPEAQKLVQEVNKFKKLLGNLDSLAQREDEIEEQENNYRELKTKRDKYKKLLGLDNSSPDTVERCCKLNKKEEKPQRYKFRLVETMEDYEKHYPCAVRDAIDAAQESVTQLNKETSRYGDGSVAYAAIAEQVNGSKEEGKFDAPVAALPELGGQTHLGKCKEFILGLSRSKRELERYVEKKYLTERAIDILRREEDKLKQALKWCKDYRAGDYPELPSWAKTYREQLRKLGLKERGETFN
jgi:hypothetical protein